MHDIVIATAWLVERSGGSKLEVGYVHDDVPTKKAGWYASVSFQGAKIMADDHSSPAAACLDLAEKLLRGAKCKCGLTVTIDDEIEGCRWRLMGQEFEPGCDAPPIEMKGAQRGDVTAMEEAWAERHGG